MVALRDAVARCHGGKVTPEQSATGESQSNGRVEVAGKTMKCLARVFKSQMEKEAGVQIQSTDAILQWLVRWVAVMFSRYKIGEDGKTAYERQGSEVHHDSCPIWRERTIQEAS